MEITLPSFDSANILIVGDIMLDRYWHGGASRISPEAPVPIVHVDKTVEMPGGAGNVALNVSSVGGKCTILSITGDDTEANTLERKLSSKQINTYFQRETSIPTITKLRVLSQHQQLIRLDFENTITPVHSQSLKQEFENQLDGIGAVIISDYGKGTVSDPQPYIRMARQAGMPILIDPKGTDYTKYRGATLLTPNRKEFEAVVGHCHNEDELITRGLKLIEDCQLEALLVTRGDQGMTLLQSNQEPFHLPAKAREVFDVTGAGDTVIALMATALASGANLQEATAIANLAASIVVTKMGAATVTQAELRRVLHKMSSHRIFSEEQLKLAVAEARRQGERIVMTNGCFDLLHLGHVSYLKQAKLLGDKLIIAVNDDASVKRLKGDSRPIKHVEDRMAILAELESVDWVVAFSESTPERLINEILPDVLVKGGDYKAGEIAGADAVIKNGGEVKIIEYIPGCSTTNFIKKITEESL